jgi:hypothetical protein
LVSCRSGWADTYTDGHAYRDAYGHADRDTHGHAYGYADLAARPPNADLNSNGYADRHADGHPVCHPDGDTVCDTDRYAAASAARIGRRLGLGRIRPGGAPRRRQWRCGDRDRHRGGWRTQRAGRRTQLCDPGGHG